MLKSANVCCYAFSLPCVKIICASNWGFILENLEKPFLALVFSQFHLYSLHGCHLDSHLTQDAKINRHEILSQMQHFKSPDSKRFSQSIPGHRRVIVEKLIGHLLCHHPRFLRAGRAATLPVSNWPPVVKAKAMSGHHLQWRNRVTVLFDDIICTDEPVSKHAIWIYLSLSNNKARNRVVILLYNMYNFPKQLLSLTQEHLGYNWPC